MATYDAGARFDNDSYYQMSVNEETDEATITGEKNGEPVEFRMGGGSQPLIAEINMENGSIDKTYQQVEDALLEGKNVYIHYYNDEAASDVYFSLFLGDPSADYFTALYGIAQYTSGAGWVMLVAEDKNTNLHPKRIN